MPLKDERLPRFAGIKTFLNLPHEPDPAALAGCDVAAIGLPFDTGSSYRVGARFGPAAMREASGMLREYNPALDVSPSEVLRMVDCGDSPVVVGDAEASLTLLTESVAQVVTAGAIPVSLGGDHTVSLAALRAVAASHGPLAMIHFDSHPDTWGDGSGSRYNHATPFRRAIEEGLLLPEQSIQLGIRGSVPTARCVSDARQLGFTVVTAEQLERAQLQEIHTLVRTTVARAPVYLSFDIDFVDPAFAPGTGTPEVGGPSSAKTLALLRGLDLSTARGLDVVEVLPAYDPAGITALLGATVAFELLSVLALSRAQSRR